MPAGRPTDYTPELGDQILELMTTGLSLAAAAAELNIHRQRVYEWEERHPEFADTVKLARSKRQLFLERRLLGADQGPVVTSTIFALKNAAGDDWRRLGSWTRFRRSASGAPASACGLLWRTGSASSVSCAAKVDKSAVMRIM